MPNLTKMKKKTVCDNIFCFDIETSNYYINEQHEVLSIMDIFARCGYDPDKTQAYFEHCEAGAMCYIWQACIDGRTVYGRELSEFRILCDYLSERVPGSQLHCWIHNISFEYQFLQEIFDFDTEHIFFTEARKPLYAEYSNITFRCSYRLTNLSLAKWGKNNGVEKKTGQLDYHIIYTPKSVLPPEALEYCEYDVLIMYIGLQKYLKRFGHIESIPLTQTGIPRKDIKVLNQKTRGMLKFVAKCQPKTPEEWKIQRAAYSGGLTLCNISHTGKVLHGLSSFDKKSAYPFAMLQKYPAGPFTKVFSNRLPNWKDGYHHICLVEFQNFNAKYDITPQSASKHILLDGAKFSGTKNNGKIMHADRFAMYVTEIDMQMLQLYYTWDALIIHSHWIAESAYMPKHILEYMLQKYADKTLLKGKDPDNYMRSKEILNSIYGMCGTALIHDTITELKDYTYEKKRPTNAETQLQLFRLQDKPYTNVLPYSYGVYVTSHQRYMLMKFAYDIGVTKCVYFDTDCAKGFFDETDFAFVEEENKRIIEWTKQRCEEQGIDYELTCPKTAEGVPQYLGTWEHDADYYEFKCSGAKRYAYRETEHDKIHITIAGVPKSAADVLHSVDDLREGLVFDIYNSRKNLLTYKDGNNPCVTFEDGYTNTNKCSVNIRPTSYTLTLDVEYKELIRQYLDQKYH